MQLEPALLDQLPPRGRGGMTITSMHCRMHTPLKPRPSVESFGHAIYNGLLGLSLRGKAASFCEGQSDEELTVLLKSNIR